VEDDPLRFSRRRFLRNSGAALAALTESPLSWLGAGLNLKSGPGWVTLHRGGKLAFELRSAWFAGNASVWTETAGRQITFGLEKSRHFGVDLAADATFELWEGVFGIQTAVHHHGLGVLFRGSAEEWLGDSGISGHLASAVTLLDVDAVRLVVSPGRVRLRADGTLHFAGESTLSLHRLGRRIVSGNTRLRLLSAAESEAARPRRTRLELQRDSHDWNFELPRGKWTYENADDLLDAALIETNEDDGRRRQRVVFCSPNRNASFRLIPDMPVSGTDGIELQLPMKEPHYRVDLNDGTHTFEAQLANPQGMSMGPLTLLLSAPASGPAMQAGDKGCCVLADGVLSGEIDNALILPAANRKPWNVAVLSDDHTAKSYADATIQMIGKKPILNGVLNFRILRPQDALDLCFRVTNVKLGLQAGGVGRLELAHSSDDPGNFSLLIADLPPQAIIMPKTACSSPTETDDCTTNCTASPRPQSRSAAPSRISMRFLSPKDPPVSLGIKTLLEWARYPLYIAPRAQQVPDPKVLNGASSIPDLATEIVVPAGFSVSPDESQAFFTSPRVRFDDGISQIWTARLSKRIDVVPGTSAQGGKTHFPVTNDRRPFLRPLVARTLADADEFVLSKQELQIIVDKLKQSSAAARHCVLSSSGAWLDFGAVWPPTADNTSSFHDTVAGLLEQRAEITIEGWLVPTGHRVTVVKSGKLQWCRENDHWSTPVLVARFIERFKIVYHQPATVSYDYMRRDKATQTILQLPYGSVSLIGKETSYLDATAASAFFTDCESGNPNVNDYWAWILPPGAATHVPFEFPVEITDRANMKHRTTMQMMVACFTQATDPSYNDLITKGYNHPPAGVDPSLDLHRERVAYAKPTKLGNTSYPTANMTLRAMKAHDLASAEKNGTIPWFPQMATTALTLEQVAAFTDPSANTQVDQIFEFASVYKKEPFDDVAKPSDNRGEVILALTKDAQGKCAPVPLAFNGSLGGGLAMPSSKVIALARKTGTVFSSAQSAIDDLDGTLTAIGQNGMNVADIFEGMAALASILGAVQLSDVLDEVSDGIAQASMLPLLAVQQLHTLEQETIGKIQEFLKPILDFQNQALAFYNGYYTKITQLQAQLQIAIRAASSLIRVIATEQRPADVAALGAQTLDGTLAALAKRLPEKLALSVLDRIQEATAWPPVDSTSQPVLPTLYQVRDYALHQLIQSSAQVLGEALDDALEAGEQQLQDALDQASNIAGQALGDLAGSLIFQFATTVGDLINAVQSADVENAINTFETVADIVAAIPSLDTSAANLRNAISQNLSTTGGTCSVATLRQRAAALSTAITQAGNSLPAPVLTSINNFLKNNGDLENTCNAVLAQVDAQVNAATALVNQALAAEEQARQAFMQVRSDVQTAIDNIRSLLTLPKHINVNYSYQTTLHDHPPFLADFNGNRSKFTVKSSVLVNLDGTPPSFDITAEVTDFRLNLIPSFPFVIVGFDVARFEAHNGQAPTVYCPFNANNVQLVGPLDFVAGLAADLDLPPEMVVQIQGLSAIVGLNIQLPEIACGAFNIVDLSVYTAIKLDFQGNPLRVIFGFANPNQHFTMTYLFLGGGGFVNFEFTPTANTTDMAVSAALEFGAMAALDFGVADGEVHIFGGFYMSLRPNDVLLSGYYRAGGEFDVLGLISASIEFLMSLNYEDRGGQAWLSGDCEVDIDVHVLFFSESVSLHMHHDFSGRSGS
jgi:hypothetical protein